MAGSAVNAGAGCVMASGFFTLSKKLTWRAGTISTFLWLATKPLVSLRWHMIKSYRRYGTFTPYRRCRNSVTGMRRAINSATRVHQRANACMMVKEEAACEAGWMSKCQENFDMSGRKSRRSYNTGICQTAVNERSLSLRSWLATATRLCAAL